MKVGILTFHYAPNYGAVWQAVGLQNKLIELGHEPVFINHIPAYMRPRMSRWRGWGLNSGSKLPQVFMHRFHEEKRRSLFRKFVKENLRVSEHLPYISDVRDYCHKLDAIIVGSDQVWNMNWISDYDDYYFLGFLKKCDIRKIAYGPCFGTRNQNPENLKKISQYLEAFDAIGMRNTFGKNIIDSFLKTPSKQVVDPAFFVNKIPQKHNSNSIFLYYVDNHVDEGFIQSVISFANKEKKTICHVKSESLFSFNQKHSMDSTNFLSPDDWLLELSSTSFVATESFHAVVFSLLIGRPFVVTCSPQRSERVLDVLNRYEQKERFYNNSNFDASFILKFDSSYKQKLQQDIVDSTQFLINALK